MTERRSGTTAKDEHDWLAFEVRQFYGLLAIDIVQRESWGGIADFSVADDGTVDYSSDPSLAGLLSGPGNTTLVVNGPNGTWYCDDDGGDNGLNPQLRFTPAQNGRYDIWVGTYAAGATQQSTLHISEVESQ